MAKVVFALAGSTGQVALLPTSSQPRRRWPRRVRGRRTSSAAARHPQPHRGEEVTCGVAFLTGGRARERSASAGPRWPASGPPPAPSPSRDRLRARRGHRRDRGDGRRRFAWHTARPRSAPCSARRTADERHFVRRVRRRAAPGRARGRADRRRRQGRRRAPGRGAPGGDAGRRPRRWPPRLALGGEAGLAEVGLRAPAPGPADAGRDGGRRRRGAGDDGGDASVEWKLDGARIQVHRAGDEVRLFTRNLNDVTDRAARGRRARARRCRRDVGRARRRGDRRGRRRAAATRSRTR